jgi:hypothetical protein
MNNQQKIKYIEQVARSMYTPDEELMKTLKYAEEIISKQKDNTDDFKRVMLAYQTIRTKTQAAIDITSEQIQQQIQRGRKQ